jgi:mono/diheme cytochrome c family protein
MMRRCAAVMLFTTVAGTSLCAEAQDAAQGKQLYAKNCIHCHGRNLVTAGAGIYDLRQFPENDKARFETSVTKGKKAMPPWGDKLTPAQIDDIWAYVMTKGK